MVCRLISACRPAVGLRRREAKTLRGLRNVVAAQDGIAKYCGVAKIVTLMGIHSIDARVLVVHHGRRRPRL
jgi:hypothetical protein